MDNSNLNQNDPTWQDFREVVSYWQHKLLTDEAFLALSDNMGKSREAYELLPEC